MSHATRTNEELLLEIEQLRSRVRALETERALRVSEPARPSAQDTSLSDQLLTLHIEHSPLAMIEWDRDFCVRQWSRRAEEMFGWSADEVMGKRLDDLQFIHVDDRERVKVVGADLLSSQIDFNTCSNRNYRRDGEVVHCHWFNSAIRDKDGHLVSLLSLAHDVTDRVDVEAALKVSEGRFKLAVRGFLMGIWEWEIESKNVYWSPHVFDQLGYKPHELRPSFQVFLSRVHPDDREQTQSAIQRSLDSGEDIQCELRLRQKRGKFRWFRAKGATEFDEFGKPLRMAGCMEDIEEQKRAEQDASQAHKALKESHFRQKLALDAGAIGTWDYDVHGDRVRADERMARIFGMDAVKVANGVPLADFTRVIHPQDRGPTEAVIGEALRTGGTHTIECRLLGKDSDGGESVRWVVARGCVEFDESGKAFRAPGALVDITERRRAENALAESEERLRLVFDHQFQCTTILSVDGIVLEVNDKPLRLQGMTRAEYVGMEYWHAPAWSNLPGWPAIIKSRVLEAASKTEPVLAQHPFSFADGRVGYADASYLAIRDEDGAVRFILVQATDVTEQKRVQEELEATQAVLSAAIEASPAGIIIADAPDARIRTVNAAALGIREGTMEELTDIPYELHPARWKCFHPDGTPYLPEDLPLSRAVLEGFVSRNVEIIIERPDGNRQWVLGNAAPVRNAEGKITGGVVVFPDVTDQRMAASALRETEAELAHVARLSTMGEMVGGIAHELNQPLYAIQNFSKASVALLEGGTELNREKLTAWLHQITEAAEHAGHVLTRLRDFVTKRPTKKTVFDMKEVFTAALAMTQFEAHQRQISVTMNRLPDLPSVSADAVQIQQVVVNLLRNAMEAIPVSDRVRQIEISAENVDNALRVSVSDSGKGLSDDGDWKMYKAFSSSKPNGMGLGLAIAKTIIESHGGNLWANNGSTGGAVFHFTLAAMG